MVPFQVDSDARILFPIGFHPPDLDHGDRVVRVLIEAVMKVAGESLVLEGLPLPQWVAQDAFQRIAEERQALPLYGAVGKPVGGPKCKG
jgi:hypothetical protein